MVQGGSHNNSSSVASAKIIEGVKPKLIVLVDHYAQSLNSQTMMVNVY